MNKLSRCKGRPHCTLQIQFQEFRIVICSVHRSEAIFHFLPSIPLSSWEFSVRLSKMYSFHHCVYFFYFIMRKNSKNFFLHYKKSYHMFHLMSRILFSKTFFPHFHCAGSFLNLLNTFDFLNSSMIVSCHNRVHFKNK